MALQGNKKDKKAFLKWCNVYGDIIGDDIQWIATGETISENAILTLFIYGN